MDNRKVLPVLWEKECQIGRGTKFSPSLLVLDQQTWTSATLAALSLEEVRICQSLVVYRFATWGVLVRVLAPLHTGPKNRY